MKAASRAGKRNGYGYRVTGNSQSDDGGHPGERHAHTMIFYMLHHVQIAEDNIESYRRLYYPTIVQAKTLLDKTGCTQPVLKDWLRKGVILPARPGNGPGVHADYDEANAVALLLGLGMKAAAITVAHYAPAFQGFQIWLRANAPDEWRRCTVVMKPETATVCRTVASASLEELAIVASLASICARLDLNSGTATFSNQHCCAD